MMNDAYLKNLSDDQVDFSGWFLEAVFMHYKTGMSDFTEEQIPLISNLLKTVTSAKMKIAMLHGVAREIQLKLVKLMNPAEVHELFGYFDDLGLLEIVFRSLDKKAQTQALAAVFKSNRENYDVLKKMAEKPQMVADILVRKAQPTASLIESDISEILDMIQNPQFSFEDTGLLAKKIEKKYDLPQLEILTGNLMNAFAKLKIPMASPENFAMHLKFHYFLDGFFASLPSLTESTPPIVEDVISALRALPKGEWTIKVLSQFPVHFITLVLTRLINGEKAADSKKRTVYLYVLKEIKQHIELKEAENVRMAFSQI